MSNAPFIIMAQQIVGVAQSGREFSQSTVRHAMASTHTAQEMVLVVLGAIVVIVTTAYTLMYLIHPGETGEDHIKRRILDDERQVF